MGKRIERAEKFKAQYDKVLNDLTFVGTKNASGDAGKAMEVAAAATPIVQNLEIRDWKVGMITAPGDRVYNTAKTYAFLYGGAATMTHANSTFFPGAAGVYYWHIIPTLHEDIKVFPNLTGITVLVQKDEIWWNSNKTKKYKWTSDAYQCPANYYPGAAGVHQWQEVTA